VELESTDRKPMEGMDSLAQVREGITKTPAMSSEKAQRANEGWDEKVEAHVHKLAIVDKS
jgi:hypothetical protein